MNPMRSCLRSLSLSRNTSIWGLRTEIRRYLLSDEYMCRDAWEERLQAPLLQRYEFNEHATKMYEKYELEKVTSNFDMLILSALMHQMSKKNVEVGEAVLWQHRHSNTYNPVSDDIVEGVVRAYIDLDLADRLLPIIQDKFNYGIILNHYSANLLMDHFIKKESIEEAVKIAYEMMLQEDFSNRVTYLLSLYACCKRLADLSTEPKQKKVEEEEDEEEEEEIQWKRVKVVHQPFYDDHFDIKDERHLLGKTLYFLGKETDMDDTLGRSLQFVGLGLWNKFPKALNLLQMWMGDEEEIPIVFQEQFEMFGNFLEWSPTRDPDAEEKDFYARTIDDEIYKLRLTPDEKKECTETYQKLSKSLESRLLQQDLDEVVDQFVENQLEVYEQEDIEMAEDRIQKYEEDCDEAFEKETQELMKNKAEREIINKLVQIGEKEELIQSFDNKNRIAVARMNMKRETIYRGPKVVDIDEEEDRKKAKKSVFKKR